jgi:hypothetical protein
VKSDTINRQKVLNAALAVKARRDLAAFVNYVIRDDQGNRVTAAPHQLAWRDHLNYCWEIGKDCAILSPMTFAKTAWKAIALPLWLIGRNPNLRIMLVSSAEDVAAKRLQEIQRYITDSPEYHEVFPWVHKDEKRQWNNQAANVIKYAREDGGFISSVDHSLSAFGYTAKAGNGARADVIIFDDVVADANCATEANRATLFNAVTTQWMTRSSKRPVFDKDGNQIAPFTIMVFIGTRYHTEDLYANLLLNSPEAFCTMIQAVSDSYENLDVTIVGAVEKPPHPVYLQYKDYI